MPKRIKEAVEKEPFYFQFLNEFGEWQSFDDDVQSYLLSEYWRTKEFNKLDRLCEIERVLRCHKIDKYQVNFQKMTQINLKTRKVRDIRAVKIWIWLDKDGSYEGALETGNRTFWDSWFGELPTDLNAPLRLLWQVGAAV